MRTPNETLPARGFSAEYFPQFHGIGGTTEMSLAMWPPRKNPDAAACAGSRQIRFRQFALGSPQRCRKTLKWASMICKYLSLMEIRSKSPVSCPGFAAARTRFGRKRIKSNRAIDAHAP
jgi:hypothetical protein